MASRTSLNWARKPIFYQILGKVGTGFLTRSVAGFSQFCQLAGELMLIALSIDA